jgi:hypothetical protein
MVCDPAASVGRPNGAAAPACAPLQAGVQPLYNDLFEGDFKDANEAEKRKIVRENGAQTYGLT